MRVQLVAKTILMDYPEGYIPHPGGWLNEPEPLDELGEIGGRLCYLSWERPNPATATNQDYLANIIKQGHFSVLEHSSATFYIDGVSRSLTHELIRHRHLSFSQVSQRYVDESDADMVSPPVLRGSPLLGHVEHIAHETLASYEWIVKLLIDSGYSRKEARQAARCVLPNATETKILVTGNMRAFREFVQKRNSPHADAEIRELAQELLRQLKEIAPSSFQDFDAPG